jgi:hypothetical protein
MDALPDDILEAVIAHLVRIDTKPAQSNPTDYQQHERRRKNALEDDSSCIFDFAAFIAAATHSFTKTIQPRPARLHTNVPTSLSNLLLNIQGRYYASPVYDSRYTDLFNVRLTCRILLSAASPSFLAHIKTHLWTLDATSLARLSKLLLLNPDLAQQITRLRFASYRFDFNSVAHDGYDKHNNMLSFTRAVETRSAYMTKDLLAQLVDIFRHTQTLKHLVVTSELTKLPQNGENHPSYPAHLDYFTRIARMPDPIHALSAALEISRVNARLVSYTSYTAVDYCLFDSVQSPNLGRSMTCANLTHLAIDSAYFMDSSFSIHCPNLVSLEIIQVERLPVHRLSNLLRRDVGTDEKDARSNMHGGLRDLILTGCSGAGSRMVTSTSTLYTSTIYTLLAYFARYTHRLRTLTIRHARVQSDVPSSFATELPIVEHEMGAYNFHAMDDIYISKLRLVDLQAQDMHRRSGSRKISNVDDAWARFGLLSDCVGSVVITSGEKCTCSWERGPELCSACRISMAGEMQQEREFEKEVVLEALITL